MKKVSPSKETVPEKKNHIFRGRSNAARDPIFCFRFPNKCYWFAYRFWVLMRGRFLFLCGSGTTGGLFCIMLSSWGLENEWGLLGGLGRERCVAVVRPLSYSSWFRIEKEEEKWRKREDFTSLFFTPTRAIPMKKENIYKTYFLLDLPYNWRCIMLHALWGMPWHVLGYHVPTLHTKCASSVAL